MDGGDAPIEYQPIRLDRALRVGESFALGADGVRALVLREVNPKEAFTLCDAEGSYFRATLVHRDRDHAEALAYEKMPSSPESPLRITLACAVLARQRMMVVMQKATELGAVRIVPVLTERSVPASGLAHEKSHAWPGQVVRAVRQCRRGSVPVVERAESMERVVTAPWWLDAKARYYLDDRAVKNTGTVALPERSARASAASVVLAVGPEGGFTDDERRLLADQRAEPLRLGSRVLRAETAVLVGLTLLQHVLGDLG